MRRVVEKELFETLFEKGICFAVNVSYTRFAGTGIDECSIDYHLMIAKTDLKELIDMPFHPSEDYSHIYEMRLKSAEIADFKKHYRKFDKVAQNRYGKVYELKNHSFKKFQRTARPKPALAMN